MVRTDLRGWAKRSAEKTHCPKGHPYDDQNTMRGDKGERLCRTCRNAYQREWARKWRKKKKQSRNKEN